MTEKACSIPTPEERKLMELQEAAEHAMLDTIYKAIDQAASSMAEEVKLAGILLPPTDRDYFAFSALQVLFVRLAGGNPDTLQGGDPELGQRIVNNGQNIIDHYWRRDRPEK